MTSSSFVISNKELGTTSSNQSKRKKRRKMDASIVVKNNNESEKQENKSERKWKSAWEHKMYASKLVDALRRRTSDCTVRQTADRVLGLAAKGRSRWSRGIVRNGLKLEMQMVKHKNKRKNGATKTTAVNKRLLGVQQKARHLGRLVPGCRNITFPNLLDEVSDYISALEMQVRAMTALTALLTSSNHSI